MNNDRPLPFPEERRLVTVLFADLTDFTQISESLDPEEVGNLLMRVWTKLDSVVEQRGGRVDKHLGDSLMSTWGAPLGTEEDAEHAVNCALALQDELARLNTDLVGMGYPELRMRIGINSGSVITSIIRSTGEYSVVGDAVNTAQRLQMIAPPGAIVIGPGTYRLVREAFRYQPMVPQHLRGKTAPVEAYIVLGPESYPTRARYRGADSLDVRLFGREKELQHLRAIYEQASAGREAHLAILSGGAGLGKSRLLLEFSRRLELGKQHPLILTARATAECTGLPFYLWEAFWTSRLGLMKDEPEEARREKFSRGLLEIWGKALGPVSSAEALHVLAYLAGLEWPDSPYVAKLRGDPAALLARAADLAAELFRRASAAGAAVLVMDDLQYADSSSLDLINSLLDKPDLPLLVLGAARAATGELHPNWSDRDNLTHLPLGALPFTADAVVAMLPRASRLPEAFRARLAERAEGNPYFLEEMVKALLQAGFLAEQDDHWQLEGGQAPGAIPLPDSLRSQLQSRLDALSPAIRGVVLAASVIGRVFWAGMVERLLRHTPVTAFLASPSDQGWQATLNESFYELQSQELIFERRGSTFLGEREFIFKSNLLRETAYNLLPRKYRQPYHALVAAAFAQRAEPGYALTAAEHYALAGDPTKAAQFYRVAGDHLQQRGYVREGRVAAENAERLMAGAQAAPGASD